MLSLELAELVADCATAKVATAEMRKVLASILIMYRTKIFNERRRRDADYKWYVNESVECCTMHCCQDAVYTELLQPGDGRSEISDSALSPGCVQGSMSLPSPRRRTHGSSVGADFP